MLETEPNDSGNDRERHGGPDPAGVAATPAGSGHPANGPEAGAQQPADPEGGTAAAGGRRTTGRTRRAVTRAAGPPAAEVAPAVKAAPVQDANSAPASSAPANSGAANSWGGTPAVRSKGRAAAVPPVSGPAVTVPPVTVPPIAVPPVASRNAVPPVVSPIAVPPVGVPPAASSAPPAAIPPATFQPPPVIFQPPAAGEPGGSDRQRDDNSGPRGGGEPDGQTRGSSRRRATRGKAADHDGAEGQSAQAGETSADQHAGAGSATTDEHEADTDGATPRRRRRGGRSRTRGDGDAPGGEDSVNGADGEPAESPQARGGRRKPAEPDAKPADGGAAGDDDDEPGDGQDGDEGAGGTRRRRRKRRRGSVADGDQPTPDDPPNTVVHVRPPRQHGPEDPGSSGDVQSVRGSTRLEAKRQRRREGRESGRRRPPVITESEFLARREAVDRVMVVRQRGERTQIAVLEDGVLVEHYVDKSSHQSFVGNVYLGKVQNVLPSMEAAFVDVGKGRNAVLYAGEVNFDASGLEGDSKRIESALKSGQSVLVQVTKDPVGHKGARLTSQVSLPGRYLVYVPGASMMGISRKLPDKERTRLKQILKQVMPDGAGVIVRTAAEGAAEEELAQDVARLSAQWESIERKAKTANAPDLLYSEPDLTIRVVRDIFNEDFSTLVVAGDEGWDLVDEYVRYVAPHLADRLVRWDDDEEDAFARYRIDEQLAKALERKVWLPSGGSLVIDNTEAMTVVDVNTGKFTGKGGNLEETVTRNNLEAAEEMVRQLRLRDIGGIIVIDFIDMVLESNRDLVLRRLLECLARDRTKHQVAEVTSLGLVQMTRKRVGSGLLEAFSEPCECCNGRGRIVSLELTDHAPEGQRGRGAKTDGRQSKDGRQARGGRQDRNGKADHGDAGSAASGPAPAGPGTATDSDAPGSNPPGSDATAAQAYGTAVSGAAVSGSALSGSGGTGNADSGYSAGTGEAAGQDAGGSATEAGGAARQGGRRRRRSATREQGPPDQAFIDGPAHASADQAGSGSSAPDQSALSSSAQHPAGLGSSAPDSPGRGDVVPDLPGLGNPALDLPSIVQSALDQPPAAAAPDGRDHPAAVPPVEGDNAGTGSSDELPAGS
jgi:ribonuclease E